MDEQGGNTPLSSAPYVEDDPATTAVRSTRSERMGRRRVAVDLAVGAVLLLAVGLAWQAGWLEGDAVRGAVDRAGVWGPVLFVATYAVLSLLPVPLGLFTVLAGAVFGGVLGVGVVWAGAMAGALLGWVLARSALLPVVESTIRQHRSQVWEQLSGTGVWPVLAVRLMPVAPFMAVNYVAGATGVPLRPYVVGTALGILPAVALYVQVGAAGLEDPAALLWALFGIVLLIGLGSYLVRRGQKPAAVEP
ncbi:TVP38/TMEM64 family protein [Ornithinimicrobium sediminis]|uniref:TVP38/TMEM64 family protein n=1 Tax=Ornithinimicrobium sediminis TaxID=2904603 RepID=UPI001E4EAA8D|nr:VTT domain-containing protein [Ornithinimicrobium sediminis]MCE0486839.1 VTT domain-containing protein [Ornithinimicrobium sediminis]